MKAKFASNQLAAILIALLIFLLLFRPAAADFASGGGTVVTPYSADEEVDTDWLYCSRNLAERFRFVRNLPGLNNEHGWLAEFAMTYSQNDPPDGLIYAFTGETVAGTYLSVAFSDVEQFELLEIKRRLMLPDQALIKLVKFPDLSPQKLISLKPTYQQLESSYRRTVKMWISLESDTGEPLRIVAKDPYGTSQRDTSIPHHFVLNFNEIRLHSAVKMEYGYHDGVSTVWWAIPSVTADPAYPFRYFTAN
jgi:hypothetical protein